MIKPRGGSARASTSRAARAAAASRPTIRIGPRASAARHEDTPDDDGTADDDEVMDVDDDGVTEEGEESALTSRAQTVDGGDEAEDASEAQGQEEEGDEKDIDVDGEEGEGLEEGEEVETPRDGEEDDEATKTPRRGRGRPRGRPKGSGIGRPRGRGRGRPRGKGRLTTRSRRDRDEEPVIEVEYAEDGTERHFRRYNGEIVYLEGDEYITSDLEEGDKKIDKDGNLLGGMSYCLLYAFHTDITKTIRPAVQGPNVHSTP